MSKILWCADAGSHGGFASVTHAIGERLVRDYGHDIHVLAANFHGDHWPTNLKLYVANQKQEKDIVGMSRIVEMCAKVQPDAIVFVQDPKVVLNVLTANPWDTEAVLWRGMETEGGYRWKPPILGYLAIDGYNSPRSWDVLTQRVDRIAMSHHGRMAMPEAPIIWHGVDTDVFYPRDKAESKRALGFDPKRFLVLRVDKNTWRKDYPATWRAMRPILRRHADIDLHLHCRRVASDGYDLDAVRWNDEDIRDRVTTTDNLGGYVGIDQERLATLYSAADLFVSTSWGEGFGLTLLEAMAVGTPVIAQDCSATSEVVGPGGILIKPAGRMHVPMGQEQCIPDVDRFTYWIEKLYEARAQRESLGRAAAEHARKFSWDEAARRFDAEIAASIERSRLTLAAETPIPAQAEVGVS